MWPTVPDVLWTAYKSQSRSLGAAVIRLADGTQVIANLALLEARAPSLAALVVDGTVDLTPSGLESSAVRTVIDFVRSDRPTETTDVPLLLPILHAADYCGAAALMEKVVSTLRDRVAGADPKTLLAIANEARSRQADDLYTAVAAQLGETAPRELLKRPMRICSPKPSSRLARPSDPVPPTARGLRRSSPSEGLERISSDYTTSPPP